MMVIRTFIVNISTFELSFSSCVYSAFKPFALMTKFLTNSLFSSTVDRVCSITNPGTNRTFCADVPLNTLTANYPQLSAEVALLTATHAGTCIIITMSFEHSKGCILNLRTCCIVWLKVVDVRGLTACCI